MSFPRITSLYEAKKKSLDMSVPVQLELKIPPVAGNALRMIALRRDHVGGETILCSVRGKLWLLQKSNAQ